MEHPVDEIRGTKSHKLSGKVIVLGVTGSIAAVESIKLARELIRHGAQVIPVMTPSAHHIIHPYALEFATGHRVIMELTGYIEHVSLCGDVSGRADALLIAPCTANTLSKIVCGIDDTPVTTFATTALGSNIPVFVVPAMHSSMYRHPKVRDHIRACKKLGITFLAPHISEGKAKMISSDEILAYLLRALGDKSFSGKKVLVIGGATREAIDEVRVITNLSSGRMAVALATEAFEKGADLELWYGYGAGRSLDPPSYLPVKEFSSIDDLLILISHSRTYDVIINCAAISDYRPKVQGGKIPSGKRFSLQLYPTPSVITKLRKKTSVLVGFKLEATKRNLVDKAYRRLKDHQMDYIIANTVETLGGNEAAVYFITREKRVYEKKGAKDDLARVLLQMIHDETV